MQPLSSRTHLALLAAVVAAAMLPALVPDYYVQFAAKVLILGTLAMALNLAVGFGGLVSLCHAAFFGLAGYALVLAAPEYDAPSLLLTLPLAVAVAAAAALVIGLLSLRTRGVYFIMVTLAFGEMLFFLFHDTPVGGGSDGLFLYVKPVLSVGETVLVDLDNPVTFYLAALAAAAGTWWLIRHLLSTPFGDALTAARDNERRALALGIPVFRVRLIAFVLSAALAGLAGYLSAAQFGFVAPQMLGWHLSATALVMVVLGGTRRVAGPLAGALVVTGLEEGLKYFIDDWKLVYGLIIIALVLVAPGGLQDLARLAGIGRRAGTPALNLKEAKNAG